VEFALSASRRSLGRSWTTPPGTRLPLTAKRGAQAPFRGQVIRSSTRWCYIRRSTFEETRAYNRSGQARGERPQGSPWPLCTARAS
jgi:hypothetical protein